MAKELSVRERALVVALKWLAVFPDIRPMSQVRDYAKESLVCALEAPESDLLALVEEAEARFKEVHGG